MFSFYIGFSKVFQHKNIDGVLLFDLEIHQGQTLLHRQIQFS